MLQVPPCPFWIVCRASVIAAGFTHYHRPRFQPAPAILFLSLHFTFAQLLKHRKLVRRRALGIYSVQSQQLRSPVM
jgi:hypothetical protein